MFKRRVVFAVVIVAMLFMSSINLSNTSPYRSTDTVQYFRAKVLRVQAQSASVAGQESVATKLLDGPDKGKVITITRPLNFGDASYRRLPIGSQVLLDQEMHNSRQYAYSDRWRLPGVGVLFLLLLILVVIVGAWRGITSIIGLSITILVLTTFVLPRIISGQSAFLVCIEGAVLITLVSVYVAHGFRARTTVAFISCLLTLSMIVGLVDLATYLTGTSEVISEQTASLLYGSQSVNLAQLLTGGTVIASLGVLYDITTGQAAAIDEVYAANDQQSFRRLYQKGVSIGREHIAALINTLALVYVGIALPTIVITAIYNHAPLIVVFNNETTVEEIVRTFVACAAMLLAVPLTTALAAYLLPWWYRNDYGSKIKFFFRAL